jgi:hypothetical protein
MAYMPIVQEREKKMSKDELLDLLMSVGEKVDGTPVDESSETTKPYEVTIVVQHWV